MLTYHHAFHLLDKSWQNMYFAQGHCAIQNAKHPPLLPNSLTATSLPITSFTYQLHLHSVYLHCRKDLLSYPILELPHLSDNTQSRTSPHFLRFIVSLRHSTFSEVCVLSHTVNNKPKFFNYRWCLAVFFSCLLEWVDLQRSFRCTAKWLRYMYTYCYCLVAPVVSNSLQLHRL